MTPNAFTCLDYFDASINRIAAWTIGSRNTLRALLSALFEPRELLDGFEAEGDFSSRLALQEELKVLPSNAVWDFYCCRRAYRWMRSRITRKRSYPNDSLLNLRMMLTEATSGNAQIGNGLFVCENSIRPNLSGLIIVE